MTVGASHQSTLLRKLTNGVDAVRTYEFTWAIRVASEQSRAAKLKASRNAAQTQKENPTD
jgi:ribosome-interacting GTPase 1